MLEAFVQTPQVCIYYLFLKNFTFGCTGLCCCEVCLLVVMTEDYYNYNFCELAIVVHSLILGAREAVALRLQLAVSSRPGCCSHSPQNTQAQPVVAP